MTVPYTPPLLTNPVINPKVGGYGIVFPYLSPSQYIYAPTAMNTNDLVQGGSAPDQLQALADSINRATAWANSYCFGKDIANKGASLCATQSVEDAFVKIMQGELRLVCSFIPIIQLDALAAGMDPSSVSAVDPTVAGQIRFGSVTIYVPARSFNSWGGLMSGAGFPSVRNWSDKVYVIWTYTNGYPHTMLTGASPTAGATSFHVKPTTPLNGLAGVIPGQTTMRIVDGVKTESVLITSVTPGTPVTIGCPPLQYAHTVPSTPDFIPVTSMPEDVELAMIHLVTSRIKSRGDDALILSEIERADRETSRDHGEVMQDVATALELLDVYRNPVKMKS